MKKILLTLITIIFVTMASAQVAAPDFTFTDTDGNTHTLSESLEDGKVIILDFFYVDCSACVPWIQHFDQLLWDYHETTVEVWSLSDRDTNDEIESSPFKSVYDNHKVGGLEGNGDAVISLYHDNFFSYGFPTFAVICNDGNMTWNVWPLSGGVPEIRALLTVDCGVTEATTAVNTIEGVSALKMAPNPATNNGVMGFTLENATFLTIDILNAYGQRVRSVSPTEYSAGDHQVTFDVSTLPAGIYFVKMSDRYGAYSINWTISR